MLASWPTIDRQLRITPIRQTSEPSLSRSQDSAVSWWVLPRAMDAAGAEATLNIGNSLRTELNQLSHFGLRWIAEAALADA